MALVLAYAMLPKKAIWQKKNDNTHLAFLYWFLAD